MLLALVVVLTSLSSISGCAWLFHRPRPDSSLALADRPWRVRCSWVVNWSGAADEKPGPVAAGSVWGEDEQGRRLVLSGSLEDGFLRVESARAASDRDDRDVVAVPKISRERITEICAATVRRIPRDGPPPLLYAVMAARDGEGIDVAMVFPAEEKRGSVSRVVVFGDSLSDSGNLKRRLIIFPGSPYWLGRFSNGPNWADLLALQGGFAVQNHAYGGAVAVPHEDVPAADLVAAIEQGAQHFVSGSIDHYVDDYIGRDLTKGRVASPDRTVFVLWGGANDYLSKEPFTGDIGTLLDRPASRAGYRRIVAETVAGLTDQVRRLHAAGARRFLIVTLPDLGKTPIVLHNESYRPRGLRTEAARRIQLSRRLSHLSAYHNAALTRSMRRLSRRLEGARIVVADGDSAVDRVLRRRSPNGRHAFDYGFVRDLPGQTLRTRRASLRAQDRCFSGGYIGGADAKNVCRQAPKVFFWDTVHPSSFAHCWISWFFQSQLARAGLLASASTVQQGRATCLRSTAYAAPTRSPTASSQAPVKSLK